MASVDNDAILEGLLFPGSRHFLLLSEAVLVEFVAQRWRARLTFPPLTSRFRRLLHTLVKRFSCLDSSSPEWGHDKCVTVTRTADGLPSGLVLLAQICSGIAKPNVQLVLSAAQVCLSLSLSLSPLCLPSTKFYLPRLEHRQLLRVAMPSRQAPSRQAKQTC
jgi:hypothetical protein